MWRDVVIGAKAIAPWLLGVVPYGLVIGVRSAQASIPTLAGWLTGPTIYSGSAQLSSIELLDAGASPAIVIAAALAINARLILYSATMAAHWAGRPRWWQAVAAYLLVDPSLAVGVDAYERDQDPARAHRQYIGGAVVLWIAWLAAIGVGAAIGGRVPAGLRLEFVVPLFLIGEVVLKVTSRATSYAVITAVATAFVATVMPLHLGPLLAIIAGVTVGIATARKSAAR